MTDQPNEPSVLELAVQLMAATETMTLEYQYELGDKYDETLKDVQSCRQKLEALAERVLSRWDSLTEDAQDLTIAAELVRRRSNAPDAETAVRNIAQRLASMPLQDTRIADGVTKLDAELDSILSRNYLLNNAANRAQLLKDIDAIKVVATKAVIELGKLTGVLKNAAVVLKAAKSKLNEVEEAIKRIRQAIDAVASVMSILVTALSIVA